MLKCIFWKIKWGSKDLATDRRGNESHVQTFLMFKKWQKSEFAVLGILEKCEDGGFDDSWAWEDEAIDFVAELGREAGKKVVF
jgi:hypothetical protein